MIPNGSVSAFWKVTVLQLELVSRHVVPVSSLQWQVHGVHLSCFQQFQKGAQVKAWEMWAFRKNTGGKPCFLFYIQHQKRCSCCGFPPYVWRWKLILSLDWSSIMHMISLNQSHEWAWASSIFSSGRWKAGEKSGMCACVCVCVELEGDWEKQYLLKIITSVICSYVTITQFEMNGKSA